MEYITPAHIATQLFTIALSPVTADSLFPHDENLVALPVDPAALKIAYEVIAANLDSDPMGAPVEWHRLPIGNNLDIAGDQKVELIAHCDIGSVRVTFLMWV